mmetsp:Transcript_37823/g.83086  ORF Transcript_37823/g.83086 Transcript_37823/m.83086 type:complete len:276 (+) Transcript_37823:731-1558(+)
MADVVQLPLRHEEVLIININRGRLPPPTGSGGGRGGGMLGPSGLEPSPTARAKTRGVRCRHAAASLARCLPRRFAGAGLLRGRTVPTESTSQHPLGTSLPLALPVRLGRRRVRTGVMGSMAHVSRVRRGTVVAAAATPLAPLAVGVRSFFGVDLGGIIAMSGRAVGSLLVRPTVVIPAIASGFVPKIDAARSAESRQSADLVAAPEACPVGVPLHLPLGLRSCCCCGHCRRCCWSLMLLLMLKSPRLPTGTGSMGRGRGGRREQDQSRHGPQSGT